MKGFRYKSRYVWFAAVLFWMAVIFFYSSQEAASSSKVSGSITYRMAEGIDGMFHLEWDAQTKRRIGEALEHPVRKAAHMTEYAVLAWLLLGNCMQYPLFFKKSYLWAGIGASCYAATDEFHQLFVKGRSGEIKDVMIDSAGACAGLLFAWLVLSVWNKFKKEKERGEING